MRGHEEGPGIRPTSHSISGLGAHVGICVPDMDEALRFYCGILGFEVIFSDEEYNEGEKLELAIGVTGLRQRTIQIAVPGGSRIELQDYEPLVEDGGAKLNRQGLNHLSFSVEDVWADYERLKEAGVRFRGEPQTIEAPGHPADGFVYVYFDDPWGLSLELMGPAAGQPSGERPGGSE